MKYSILLLISLAFLSCTQTPADVEEVLNKAGSNKPALEKVIKHYKDLKDNEKLKAAYFLIGNMQDKYGKYGDFAKNYYPVFEKLHALTDQKIDKDTIERIIKIKWDSIEKVVGPLTNQNCPAYYDYSVISADYLIENIDMSFKAWKEKPWAKHLNFNQFCEYILPYRIYDEPLQFFKKRFYDEFSWLSDSLKDKSDPAEACLVMHRYFAKKFIFCPKLDRCPMPGINDLYTLEAGICEHRYLLIASIMRSVGIPVGVDFPPQYNRWPGSHPWLVLLDKTGRTRFLNAGEPNVGFSKDFWSPINDGRSTKIYRNTFARQKNSIFFKLKPDDIPKLFQNPCLIDVTDEYGFPQTTVKFDVHVKPTDSKYIFLCCFGLSYQIVPLTYTTSSNRVTFQNIGNEAIYFPAYCKNNQYIIAGNPNVYPNKADPYTLNPNLSKLVTAKLTRKYPGGGAPLPDYAKWMIGAKLQASDNKDFKNPITLFTIDTIYYDFAEKDIHLDKQFRYYRYLSSDSGKIRIADVDFVISGMVNTVNKSKKFKTFGYARRTEGTATPVFENAFDGNIGTNFNAPAGSWAAIDYGKPVSVSKVRFLVRNDLNVVEIGDEYELLYFDLGWKSINKKKANHNYIIFDNVPDKALLLLRDLTKGHEERIFVYQKGKQVWW
jgi:hypothetical protein